MVAVVAVHRALLKLHGLAQRLARAPGILHDDLFGHADLIRIGVVARADVRVRDRRVGGQDERLRRDQNHRRLERFVGLLVGGLHVVIADTHRRLDRVHELLDEEVAAEERFKRLRSQADGPEVGVVALGTEDPMVLEDGDVSEERRQILVIDPENLRKKI